MNSKKRIINIFTTQLFITIVVMVFLVAGTILNWIPGFIAIIIGVLIGIYLGLQTMIVGTVCTKSSFRNFLTVYFAIHLNCEYNSAEQIANIYIQGIDSFIKEEKLSEE